MFTSFSLAFVLISVTLFRIPNQNVGLLHKYIVSTRILNAKKSSFVGNNHISFCTYNPPIIVLLKVHFFFEKDFVSNTNVYQHGRRAYCRHSVVFDLEQILQIVISHVGLVGPSRMASTIHLSGHCVVSA